MKQPERFLPHGLILLLFGLISSTILLGSVPPVDRDALTHHLFVPKLWLQHGSIYEIPEIPFSYYPMNLDLLYTIPLYFGNDIIPKYIHYLFALLTGLLLYQYLDKRLGKVYGLFGALFFLSVPIIIKLSITVYVDLGVVFFSTAALLSLLYWAEHHFCWRYLILAGLSCGLAAGTKYNGLISIAVLTLLVPILYQQSVTKEQQHNGKALLWGVIFAAATLISFSPWLVKNYVWTGNPIYPLHDSLVQRLKIQIVKQDAAPAEQITEIQQRATFQGSGAFVSRKILYNESWWQTLFLPIRFFLEGQDDDPRYFDGKLTPFLLILPLIAFILRPADIRQRREQNLLLWFTLLSFFFTFFQEALRIRYVVTIVPPLVILSMYGLKGIYNSIAPVFPTARSLKKPIFFMVGCIPGLMLWYNVDYVATQFIVVKPLPYLQGKVSRDEYISSFRTEYPAIQYVNSIVSPNAKVLCLFMGNRGYYMDFQPIFEQPYASGSILSQFLATEGQQHSIIDELRQRNIKHILFRTDLTTQWLHQLSEHDLQRIAALFAHSDQPLWSGHDFVVFAVD